MSAAQLQTSPQLTTDLALGTAQVIQLQEGSIFIKPSGAGPVAATCATSCLVAPKQGDSVLFFSDSSAKSYILAVLESANSEQLEIHLDAEQVNLTSAGSLKLASKNLHLATSEQQLNTAKELRVTANSGKFNLLTSCLNGRESQVNLTHRLQLVANQVSNIVDTLTQQCQKYCRYVSEVDLVKSASIIKHSLDVFKINTKNITIDSDQEMQVTAQRVNFNSKSKE
jgi:hypothetical protein